MRKLLIKLVILLVLLLAGGVVWVGLNANSLVARHRVDIEKALSASLKTEVTLGAISATVFPKTALLISDLNLGGGLTLTGVSLDLSPLALLSGTLKVNKLSIDNPAVTLLQTTNGFALKGLTAPVRPAATATTSASKSSAEATPSAAAGSPVSLALDSFALKNGSVLIEMRAPAKPLLVKDINVTSGFNLSGSTVTLSRLTSALTAQGITAGASAASIKADTATSGIQTDRLVLSTPAGDINVVIDFARPDSGKGSVTTTQPLAMAPIAGLVSQIAPVAQNLTGGVGLNLNAIATGENSYQHTGEVTLSEIGLSVAPYDLTSINGTLAVSGDAQIHKLSTESINAVVNGQNLKLALAALFDKSAMKAQLTKLKVSGFGGTITAAGSAGINPGATISARVEVEQVALQSLLSILKNPALAALQGSLHKIDAQITTVNGAALMTKLAGTARFDVRDGSLPGVNVIGPVLKALEAIPLLTGKGAMPPAVHAAAKAPNTAFKSVTGSLQIADGVARSNDLALTSELFDLKAAGTFSAAGAVSLKASMFLEPGISAAIAGKQAKKILDAQGRLEVPLSIFGTPGAFTITPDINRLLESAAGSALRNEASKLLEKAFGGGKKGEGLFGF